MGMSLFGRKALLIAGCIFAVSSLSPASIIADANATKIDVDSGGDIKDHWQTQPTDFTFTVTQSGTVQDVNLRLAIEHTYVADLTIVLSSPGGARSVTLFDQFGGPDDDFKDTLFADDNTIDFIGESAAPYAGTYRPGNGDAWDDMADFNGISITGTWTLSITDDADGDWGYLYAPGDTPEPWTSMIGTQLILQIPEPLAAGVLAMGGMVILVRRRRRLA